MNEQIALVTGANRGIGFEVSRQLAQKGIHVLLTSRDEARGKAATQKLVSEGLTVSYHRLDVTDRASIYSLCELVEREYGRLDILVNNAGVYIDNRHQLLDVDFDILRLTMDTTARCY
jgi:NAD(P)-dependent dehydrogenase (short-subunit alcohol dehydrogenase family)